MTRISDDRQLVPTILDRLLDDNPGQVHDPLRTSGFLLRELKKSVRRDLENLLNTRYRCREIPSHLEELETSLLNYGIPDFTGAVFANEDDRKDLRRIIERIIRQFEPRFKEVTVHLDTKSTSNDRVIRCFMPTLHRSRSSLIPNWSPPATCFLSVAGNDERRPSTALQF
jgi:type VI secretion system protein ImpF